MFTDPEKCIQICLLKIIYIMIISKQLITPIPKRYFYIFNRYTLFINYPDSIHNKLNKIVVFNKNKSFIAY